VTFALVLISAFLHASWNALIKREPHKDRALIAAAGIGGLFGLGVAIVRAVSSGVPPFATHPSLGWSLVAGTCEQAYFFTLARALDRGPLGPVYTISRGGALVLVYPLSILLFGEPLTALSTAGSLIVLSGLVVPEWLRDHSAEPMPRQAIGWAVVCACTAAPASC
jgi:multidrug transporter EmrE-like cation transporter